MEKDYYGILGVPRSATKGQIKDSYRKLAFEWHPDRNKTKDAEEKFKRITEAYAVLSDDQKKQQYDAYGSADFSKMYSQEDIFKNSNFEEIFRNIGFGSDTFGEEFGSIFGRMFFGGMGRKRHGEDLQYEVRISLEDAAHGVAKEIHVQRMKNCESCDGTGSADSKKSDCSVCKGTGQVRNVRQTGYSQYISIMPCGNCNGTGKASINECKTCHGKGGVTTEEKLGLKIPKGAYEGYALRIRGKGNAIEGHEGDLYLVISVAEHPVFKRDAQDIYCEEKIPFSVAVLGGEVEVPTLEGTVKLRIPAGTQVGKTFRLHGKGIFDLRIGAAGDEYVRISIDVPQKLSKRQRELLEELDKEGGKTRKRFFGKFF
ncbi:MAG: molecular chaperone DnaJ [Candidatus Micrarchaeota archaeon]